MEQSQPEKRRHLEQEFQASLEELEDILQESLVEDEETTVTSTDNIGQVTACEDETHIDLAALEDAVADIENYLEEITKSK
ncbi:conserved hypothetical protein [Trichormus variabilis ATCC 29413]|uniref:Uncharacterized protein n=2 Tax=Anabaena variabilis TaxID=264691 RepID=Q3MD76_TRIV2|nr:MULTISPECIES: hypothetical protein [Nostocaceae]ABA21060.1 conserved hypothetical protein [Trichormus variabilis ATCC 29413]MBC1217383.1 hypothetical protein [Trichormus variabilis ARAD]MBC1257654.1 hypothetical protein [Trichormus variabilis V5]MBC1269910.1 hypothetical protein [Trichormus variabilis FSR]MBC1305319.1 hypothetical protein [Trichormus variabilis N2B]